MEACLIALVAMYRILVISEVIIIKNLLRDLNDITVRFPVCT